jgi:hypothetical protein
VQIRSAAHARVAQLLSVSHQNLKIALRREVVITSVIFIIPGNYLIPIIEYWCTMQLYTGKSYTIVKSLSTSKMYFTVLQNKKVQSKIIDYLVKKMNIIHNYRILPIVQYVKITVNRIFYLIEQWTFLSVETWVFSKCEHSGIND